MMVVRACVRFIGLSAVVAAFTVVAAAQPRTPPARPPSASPAPAPAPAAPAGMTPAQIGDAIAAERKAADGRADAERKRLDGEIARLDAALTAAEAERAKLAADVKALKDGLAKKWHEGPLVVALASALLALLASGALALVTRRLALGDRRRERAQALIDGHIASRAQRAEALGVLGAPGSFANPVNQNKVKGLGDSLASLAKQWLNGTADAALLEAAGMRRALDEFWSALEAAAARDRDIAALLGEWEEIKAVLGR